MGGRLRELLGQDNADHMHTSAKEAMPMTDVRCRATPIVPLNALGTMADSITINLGDALHDANASLSLVFDAGLAVRAGLP